MNTPIFSYTTEQELLSFARLMSISSNFLFLYRPHQKTLFRMMQSSNLVVSIVEHVYRMNALLLYITLRNSPQWGLFLSLLGAIPGGYILTHYGRCFGTYVHMKQTICLHTWCLCFLLLSGMPGLKLLLVTLLKIVALHFNLTTWYI